MRTEAALRDRRDDEDLRLAVVTTVRVDAATAVVAVERKPEPLRPDLPGWNDYITAAKYHRAEIARKLREEDDRHKQEMARFKELKQVQQYFSRETSLHNVKGKPLFQQQSGWITGLENV